MSEEKHPLGKVTFDAAYDQWADGLIGSPTVQWPELDGPAQTGWDIIAQAVAAHVGALEFTPVGHQGAAAHTFTTACDGFHPVGQQCNLPAGKTVSVRKGDLDILVAAVGSWAPHDMAPETSEAFGRLLNAFDEAHADGAPGEPAKVIVVTDDTGRDRRYGADEWQAEEAIDVLCAGEVIVTYPQGTWRRATVEGTELDGVTLKARRFQSALRQVAKLDAGVSAETLQDTARTALARDGWDEEDL